MHTDSIHDVFLSYSRQDRETAEAFMRLLTEVGWDVWWDENLRAGQRYRPEIRERHEASRCVLVIWSRHAVASTWVSAEAARAGERIVQVHLDPEFELPLPYSEHHFLDFSGWRGERTHANVEPLIESIEHHAGPGLPARLEPVCAPDALQALLADELGAAEAAHLWAARLRGDWRPDDVRALAVWLRRTAPRVGGDVRPSLAWVEVWIAELLEQPTAPSGEPEGRRRKSFRTLASRLGLCEEEWLALVDARLGSEGLGSRIGTLQRHALADRPAARAVVCEDLFSIGAAVALSGQGCDALAVAEATLRRRVQALAREANPDPRRVEEDLEALRAFALRAPGAEPPVSRSFANRMRAAGIFELLARDDRFRDPEHHALLVASALRGAAEPVQRARAAIAAQSAPAFEDVAGWRAAELAGSALTQWLADVEEAQPDIEIAELLGGAGPAELARARDRLRRALRGPRRARRPARVAVLRHLVRHAATLGADRTARLLEALAVDERGITFDRCELYFVDEGLRWLGPELGPLRRRVMLRTGVAPARGVAPSAWPRSGEVQLCPTLVPRELLRAFDPSYTGPDPAVVSTWFEAEAFTRWLSAHTERPFGLPTRDEGEGLAVAGDNREWIWPARPALRRAGLSAFGRAMGSGFAAHQRDATGPRGEGGAAVRLCLLPGLGGGERGSARMDLLSGESDFR
ncbi:MAG: TIR domain-containing protein [bacterium]|nr:TIR domain-containing protein [bacterium]